MTGCLLLVLLLLPAALASTPRCHPAANINWNGTISNYYAVPLPEACCFACVSAGAAACQGASYVQGVCYLYSSVADAVPCAGGDSCTAFANTDTAALRLLVEGWPCRDVSWAPASPACNWQGVTCASAQAGGAVTGFGWSGKACASATVDLGFLPSTVTALNLLGSGFAGPLDLTTVPDGLQTLYVDNNSFSGPADLTQLPAALTELWMDGNAFTGAVNLTALPASLVQLFLYGNDLNGTLDLGALPASLRQLVLNGNAFAGPLDLSRLPPTLDVLALEGNPALCGSTRSSLGCAHLQLPATCGCNASTNIVRCQPCTTPVPAPTCPMLGCQSDNDCPSICSLCEMGPTPPYSTICQG